MIFLLYTGTSALILYISNIQSWQKYNAVMYYLAFHQQHPTVVMTKKGVCHRKSMSKHSIYSKYNSGIFFCISYFSVFPVNRSPSLPSALQLGGKMWYWQIPCGWKVVKEQNKNSHKNLNIKIIIFKMFDKFQIHFP